MSQWDRSASSRGDAAFTPARVMRPRHGAVVAAVLGTVLLAAPQAQAQGAAQPAAQGAAQGATQVGPVFPPAFRLGMVPPPGFVPSPSFPGFQHAEKQASIVMAELPAYAFEGIEREVTGELQKDQQPTKPTREDITLKDGKGFVLFARPPSGPQGPVLKWTMVANTGGVTAVVTAMVPEAVQDAMSPEVVKAAFQSLTVRAVPLAEQMAVLPFALDQLAGFRIVRVQPGSAAMLTDGPSDSVQAAEQPLLMISIIPAQTPTPPNERDGLSRRLLGDLPGLKEAKVTRSEPLRVAGQQGHEVLLEAKDSKTGEDVNAVQWLRFGAGTLMRVVGIARKSDWPDAYRRFREVRDGIGPK